jgi:tetratricopeptide (TPR) repeat protein
MHEPETAGESCAFFVGSRSAMPHHGDVFPMPTPFRYWAFISYCHQDRKRAARLQANIENFRLPRRSLTGAQLPERLRPVFRDREALSSGHDLTAAIREALDSSEYLLVVCSPASAASRWVAAEILHFIGQRGPEKILCFVVDGVPNSPDPAHECLPEPLRSEHTGREVLAADARPEGDGWRDAILKTVAGLTGLPFDALARREQTRLRRRATTWTAAGLLLAVVFGALAFYSARNAAAARESAQRAELINSYLEEVLLQFSPRERDNAARSALLPLIDASTTPDRLRRLERDPMALLRVRYILGRAYLELNAAEHALPLLEKNVALARELYGPDHLATITSMWSLGNILNAVGQHERGAEVHQHLLDTALRIHGEKSEEALGAMTNLAISLEAAGRTEEATALRMRVYELGRQFLPADHIYFQGARLNYAGILMEKGQSAEALAMFEELERDQLESLGPDHLVTLETQALLGKAYEANGQPERAAGVYGSAAQGLARIQGPDNSGALTCAFRLIEILDTLGRPDEAAAVAKEYFGRPPDPRKLEIIGKKPSDLPR